MKLKFTFFLPVLVVGALFGASQPNSEDLEGRVSALENRPTTPPYRSLEKGIGISMNVAPLFRKVSQDGLEYAITSTFDVNITDLSGGNAFFQVNLLF